MSLDNSTVVPALPTGGYTIDQSLRFDLSSEAYLSRSMTSTGNRKTWTWSAWLKVSDLQSGSSYPTFFDFASTSSSNTRTKLYYNADDTIGFQFYDGSNNYYVTFAPVFRDLSAWYHFVVRCDTTQSTASDRLRLYVNGEEVSKSAEGAMPQNHDTYANLSGYTARVGNAVNDGGYQRDYGGYMAEVHHIDGQSLDPTNFGETGDYGEWKPIRYTGSYGTNGFYLDFDGTYYNDKSGNGNNWTANNLSSYDVVPDSPTNNFCTFNYLMGTDCTYTEGNLRIQTPVSQSEPSGYGFGTMIMNSTIGGKWYWEIWCDQYNPYSSDHVFRVGIHAYNGASGNNYHWYRGYSAAPSLQYNGGTHESLSNGGIPENTIIGVAYDADNRYLTFYQNGSQVGSQITSNIGDEDWFPHFSDGSGGNYGIVVANFGQDSSFAGNKTAQGNTDDNSIGDFYYTPPSGYLALCTANLPDPDVIPSENFNTILYTGNSTNRSLTGVGFQPDWLWIKCRSDSADHITSNVLSGPHCILETAGTSAENCAYPYGDIDSFDSDGFSISGGTNSSLQWHQINLSGRTYVAWNWKANGSGVSNTNGSITSTVSANQDAGFSIVAYTGNSTTGSTVGHGLSKAPEMVIIKNRDTTGQWQIYHRGIYSPNAEDYFLMLNQYSAAAVDGSASRWNNTDPSSTVVTFGNDWEVNNNGQTFIMYAFHSVDGFSKFGSYVGNSSADGTFVYTGFRPAFVMVKSVTSDYREWYMFDNARDPDNSTHQYLRANTASAEGTASNDNFDFVSNGFKIRVNDTYCNSSSETYIYMCFAEYPFKHTNAR